MFSLSNFSRSFAPLLACLLFAGCMDESFDQYEDDTILEAELLEEAALLEAEASEFPVAVPNPIPCDPDAPPLEVNAPEDEQDEGDYPPAPLRVQAPDFDGDDDNCDDSEDDDCEADTEGEDLSPAPFGIDAQDFDPDAPPPVELDNPDDVFADPDHQPW